MTDDERDEGDEGDTHLEQSDAARQAREDLLTRGIIGIFYRVYNRLGYGFVESVYARAMALQLQRDGYAVRREALVEVRWDDDLLGHFRADVIVNESRILEFKAGTRIVEADVLQLVNYLRATGLPIGLLLHFGPKPFIRRITNPERSS